MKHLGFGYSSRQGAKKAKFGQIFFLFLCGLCGFAGDTPIFGCGIAGLGVEAAISSLTTVSPDLAGQFGHIRLK
jgi:hypothetical protein